MFDVGYSTRFDFFKITKNQSIKKTIQVDKNLCPQKYAAHTHMNIHTTYIHIRIYTHSHTHNGSTH